MKTDRPRRRLRRGLLALVILAALALFGYWQCWGVTATETEVTLAALPAGFDGLRIAHLSDLHGHEYGQNSDKLAGMTAELYEAFGPDSLVGHLAGVLMGSTETIFYTLGLYFGAAGIRRSRYTLPAALLCTLIAALSGLFFGTLLY